MQQFNLIEMWRSMLPLAKTVVIILAIMSVYSLFVMIDRFYAFTRDKRNSMAFVLALRKQLKTRDLEEALRLSQKQPQSPIARVVAQALSEYRDGIYALTHAGPDELGEFDVVDAVNRVLDRAKEREVASLKKGLGGLASISSAAPFIGLFGTVVGIINAFRAMAATGQGGLGAVSAGIAEALFTTAAGLLVAIPAVMSFNYFTNTIEAFVVEMNDVSSELLSFVLREGRDRK